MPHENLAIENRARLAIQNSLVQLMAGAVRLLVIDYGMRVCVLPRADDVQAVNPTLRAFVIHNHTEVVSRKLGAKRDVRCVEAAVASEGRPGCRHVESACAFILHSIMLE